MLCTTLFVPFSVARTRRASETCATGAESSPLSGFASGCNTSCSIDHLPLLCRARRTALDTRRLHITIVARLLLGDTANVPFFSVPLGLARLNEVDGGHFLPSQYARDKPFAALNLRPDGQPTQYQILQLLLETKINKRLFIFYFFFSVLIRGNFFFWFRLL